LKVSVIPNNKSLLQVRLIAPVTETVTQPKAPKNLPMQRRMSKLFRRARRICRHAAWLAGPGGLRPERDCGFPLLAAADGGMGASQDQL